MSYLRYSLTVLSLFVHSFFSEYFVSLHGVSIWSDGRGKHILWITNTFIVHNFSPLKTAAEKRLKILDKKDDLCIAIKVLRFCAVNFPCERTFQG